MTKVVCTTRNNQFKLIRVEGHAAYAQQGSDIVCAGISSIIEGTLSFFRSGDYQGVVVSRDELGTSFSVVRQHSGKNLQACLQLFIHQLRNISHFYPSYIAVHFR